MRNCGTPWFQGKSTEIPTLYLEDHPRIRKWLGSPPFISHKVRPFASGPTTRSLGNLLTLTMGYYPLTSKSWGPILQVGGPTLYHPYHPCMVYLPTYIYHKNQPNVAKYTIHGSYGSQGPPFFSRFGVLVLLVLAPKQNLWSYLELHNLWKLSIVIYRRINWT